MKKFIIFLIKAYQKIPSPIHATCRHVPTCSNYAIEAIERYGCLKGCLLSAKRIIRCNPLGSSGVDPVPYGKGRNL